jgi:hypothetical protein
MRRRSPRWFHRTRLSFERAKAIALSRRHVPDWTATPEAIFRSANQAWAYELFRSVTGFRCRHRKSGQPGFQTVATLLAVFLVQLAAATFLEKGSKKMSPAAIMGTVFFATLTLGAMFGVFRARVSRRQFYFDAPTRTFAAWAIAASLLICSGFIVAAHNGWLPGMEPDEQFFALPRAHQFRNKELGILASLTIGVEQFPKGVPSPLLIWVELPEQLRNEWYIPIIKAYQRDPKAPDGLAAVPDTTYNRPVQTDKSTERNFFIPNVQGNGEYKLDFYIVRKLGVDAGVFGAGVPVALTDQQDALRAYPRTPAIRSVTMAD